MKAFKVLRYPFLVSVLLIIVGCDLSKVPIPVSFITLSESQIELGVGEIFELECVVSPYDADNKRVIWSSSNGSIASVNDGVVVGIKVGEAVITAKSDDGGKTAECIVTVKEQSDIDSFLSGIQGNLFTEEIKGLDDFELICFLVIK